MKPDDLPFEPPKERIRTRIWLEEPEADNPFVTRAAWCQGYDVFGELLGRVRWVDMLYLLFKGQPPSTEKARLLEALAVMLANAGPRDPAVHAAMAAGVGGSPAAAALMAALAVGAGQHTGAREVYLAMQAWQHCAQDLSAWRALLAAPQRAESGIWPAIEHPPGFDLNATRTALPVQQALQTLAAIGAGPCLPWLSREHASLELAAGHPLALTGVAAAAFTDLGFGPDEGELLHLLLRLPGAAAHALEQRALGHKNFPFFRLELADQALQEAA